MASDDKIDIHRTHALQNFQKFGLLTDTIKNEGVNLVDWQKPIDNTTVRRNLAAYLKLSCPKVNDTGEITNPTLPDGEELARLILGDDYLSPEDVVWAYGWSYNVGNIDSHERHIFLCISLLKYYHLETNSGIARI